MSSPLTRQNIIDTITRALTGQPWARAAWLGGSDANGRRDRFSDIDYILVVQDDHVEDSIAAVRAALSELAPVELEFRFPRPTWHGHDQLFCRLQGADPHLLIDFTVMKSSTPPGQRFLEPDRHGVPLVLFDHDAFIAPVPIDTDSHLSKLRARLERIRVTFPLFQPLVTRAVERDQPCDAAHFYMQLTLVPLVELLRMAHCPDRFDFGLRYLRDDLPPDVYARVCRLALPGSLEGIRACRDDAERLFNETLPLVRV